MFGFFNSMIQEKNLNLAIKRMHQEKSEKLTNHLSGYQKGYQDIFNKIQDKLNNAITNARRVEQFHQTSGTDNPSTLVHSLVEYSRDWKKQ